MVVYSQFEFLSKVELVSSRNSHWYIVDVLYLSLTFLLAISQESPLASTKTSPHAAPLIRWQQDALPTTGHVSQPLLQP